MISAKRRRGIVATRPILGVLVAVFVAICLVPAASRAQVFEALYTVNTTQDSPDANPGDNICDADGSAAGEQCTLRAAIQEANAAPGRGNINFGIASAQDSGCNANTGICTISPDPRLPDITEAVTIDGYTQPGADANTETQPGRSNANLKIRLRGPYPPATNSAGLVIGIGVTDVTIKGLAISSFGEGITLVGSGSGHKIEGNFIGAGPLGTADEGNVYGVHFSASSDSTVGGTDPEDRNVISGNDAFGVWLEGGPTGVRIQGNLIGVNRNGNLLGNDLSGVRLSSAATGNRILSNSIYANGDSDSELGIDLGPTGVTPNDPDDPDAGPNNLQNFPVLTSATNSAATTNVQGNLNSTPNQTFTLQFFSNPSGNEGKTFVGQRSVTTNANGNDSFTFTFPVLVASGQTVTATATDAQGNTSEFSAPKTVADGIAPAVSRAVPAENATRISPAANVLAFFAEPMRPESLSTTTFRLRKAGASASVAARITYDDAAGRATLNPNANLKSGSTYFATITPGARDVSGNQLDQNPNATGNQPKNWRFTVRR